MLNVMGSEKSKSLQLAEEFLGKEVKILIDRPLGSKHPKYDYIYEVNYGYVPGVKAPDEENLDAYYLGTDRSLESVSGVVKAIVHRLDDDDDKLVVMPDNVSMSNEEIEKAVKFQERWFRHKILRNFEDNEKDEN